MENVKKITHIRTNARLSCNRAHCFQNFIFAKRVISLSDSLLDIQAVGIQPSG